jgi:hypothetical protein
MPNRLILSLTLLSLSACASVRTYDLSKMQEEQGQAAQSADSLVQKAELDLREKQKLVLQIHQAKGEAAAESEEQIARFLKKMEAELKAMQEQKRALKQAQGQIASMSYSYPKIASTDAPFEVAQTALEQFEEAKKGMNAAAVNYSRESHSLQDLFTAKKLFLQFDVAAFEQNLQKNTKLSQNTYEGLKAQLAKAEAFQSAEKDAAKVEARRNHFEALRLGVSTYSEKGQAFARIGQQMQDVSLGRKLIPSTDPQYGKVQELVRELDDTVSALAETDKLVKSLWEKFRNPSLASAAP